MRGYLRIVPVAPRGSNGLYVRRESADRLESPLSGPGVQETGCGTVPRLSGRRPPPFGRDAPVRSKRGLASTPAGRSLMSSTTTLGE